MNEAVTFLLAAVDWCRAHQGAILAFLTALAGLSLGAILWRAGQGGFLTRHGRLFQIAVPQGADVQPFRAEQMFAALRGLQEPAWRRLFGGPDHIALEIAGDASGIRFYLWAPARIAHNVVREIHSTYEQADIRELPRDYLQGPGQDALGLPHRFPSPADRHARLRAARLRLRRDIALPIKTLKEFEKTDPLAGITAAMAGLTEGEGMVVQLLLQPGGDRELTRRARTLTERIERRRTLSRPAPDGTPTMRVVRDYTAEEQQQVKAIGGKRAKLPFRVSIRLLALAPTGAAAYGRLRGLAAAFEQFNVATLNGWVRRSVWFAPRSLFLRHVRARAFPLWGTRKAHRPLTGEHDVLTIEELSSLWHLPHPEVVETPGLVWSLSRVRAIDAQAGAAAATDGLVIARTVYRGERQTIALPVRALFTNVGLIGLPGSGKTTLLARLALECIRRGIAVVLLDPHGDLCEQILPRVPQEARDRVIYFHPAGDLDRPMGLNFLEAEPGQHPSQVKSEVVTMLLHLFGAQLVGPRSEYILANCLQTLQELGGMTILEINALLMDEAFREAAILRVRNPAVRDFWQKFYRPLVQKNPRLQLEAASPSLNKVGAFATDPRVAHVVGQAVSSFRLREVLDGGGALVCNLAQGGLGLDNSRLLGGAIASRVIQAAMARESVPEADRRPACFIADEFHIFVGPAFPQALPQVRKYRLGMVLACQQLAQLEEVPGMRAAFLAAGTLGVFKVSAEDAAKLSAELTGFFAAADLVRLDPYQVALRVASGHTLLPFSGETIPLDEGTTFDPAAAAAIRERCRERYGRPVAAVEREIHERKLLVPGEDESSPPGDGPIEQVAGEVDYAPRV